MIYVPRRVVLFGVSKSGKSTMGDLLQQNFAHQVAAFADPIKKAAKLIFGFDDEHLYGPSHARETRYPEFEFTGWCFECETQCDHNPRTGDASHDYWVCEECGATYPRHISVRLALQTLGTAWGRKLCANLWADRAFAQMDARYNYVITDGRFNNERAVSLRRGGFNVLLLRALEESTSTHPSETEVRSMAQRPELFDLVLDNRSGEPAENFLRLLDGFQAVHAGQPTHDITWSSFAS